VGDADDDCGCGRAGSCFDRLAVSGAADRDCATDCGRDGTGGTGGVGVSALFDGDGRVALNVIDRDLRKLSDSLRRRVPVEEGEATDGAGAGRCGDGDTDLEGERTAKFDGPEGRKGS
jgi:hypothetical protein